MNKKSLIILASSLLLTLGINSTSAINPQPMQENYIHQAMLTAEELDVPSEFGSEVGRFTSGSDTYINYAAGYVKFDGSAYTYYSGRNIDSTLVTSLVDVSKLTSYIGNEFATSEDGDSDNVRNILPRNYSKTGIKNLFTAKYTEFYNNGVILGSKLSKVKCWNGLYIIQEFRYGDSDFDYDEGRKNISILLYQYKTEECFVIKDGFIDALSNNTALGQPKTDAKTMNVVLPGASQKTDELVQLFDNGFIYKNGNEYIAKVGYLYNDDGTFARVCIPTTAPGEYGDIKSRVIISDDKQIVVYDYGSVICTKNSKGDYDETLRPGRIYTAEDTFTMVDIQHFYDEFANDIASSYNQTIADLIKAKYKECYDNGYFIGFKEGTFDGSWNGVTAQQFKWGDSTANPWDDGRDHIAALVYNEGIDTTAGEKEVVLLKDTALELWDNSWSVYGSPVTDEFIDEGDGKTIYQQFKNGLLVIANGDASLSFFFEGGNITDYLAGKADYEKPSIGKTVTVTTKDNMPILLTSIIVPTVVVIGGIFVVVLMLKKKQKKSQERKDQ